MLEKLKRFIQVFLQNSLGYSTYLFLFGVYRVIRFNLFKDDADFNCFIHLIHKQSSFIVIDAGANVGYTSVIFAHACPNAYIYAYEPVSLLSSTIKKLSVFFKKNNIVIKQLALGNLMQVVAIKTPIVGGVKKQGLTYVDVHVERSDLFNINQFLIEEVNMVKLDNDFMDASLPIGGIKIDVENFEIFVLEGAIQILEKHKPIVMAELWGNDRKIACMDLMKGLNYSVKVFDSGRLVDYCGQEALNYFFIPNSK